MIGAVSGRPSSHVPRAGDGHALGPWPSDAIDQRCVRSEAFRAAVLVVVGSPGARSVAWNSRTQLPTFATFGPVLRVAASLGLRINDWLYSDAEETALEACHANWQPAVRGLAGDARLVPSVGESLAAFNRHVLPMERAQKTRSKYLTHRLSVLTWAC